MASVWRDLGAVEEKRRAKSGRSRNVFKVIFVSTRFESGLSTPLSLFLVSLSLFGDFVTVDDVIHSPFTT